MTLDYVIPSLRELYIEMYWVYFYRETKKLQASRQSWILDWIPGRGFRIQGKGFQFLSVELLDPVFQSLVGFQIPWAVFRIPEPRIPVSASKNFPDSGIWIPLHVALNYMERPRSTFYYNKGWRKT